MLKSLFYKGFVYQIAQSLNRMYDYYTLFIYIAHLGHLKESAQKNSTQTFILKTIFHPS